MIKFEFLLNDILEGDFTLGMYSCRGEDENGAFYALVIGVFFFEIWISKYE